MTTIYMSDIRAAKMCSKGTRAFFKKHDMDWSTFIKEGLPSEEFERTGDAMALQVVEVAREHR